MQKYQDVVLKPDGSVIQGASVLVQSFPGAVTSTIYFDDGVTTQANPMTTDSLGRFAFYAADGDYQLVVSGASIATQTVTGIQLLDLVPNPVFAGVVSTSGIKFPATQVASTNPNTLDDYEEGSWTPVVTASSGTITTVGAVLGRYIKTGASITVHFDIAITTNGTGAGTVVLSGVPFTSTILQWTGCGREQNISGSSVSVIGVAGAAQVGIQTFNNAYPGGNGTRIVGQFETMLL